MSEHPTAPQNSAETVSYATPAFGEGQPKLLRLGGAIGIAGCIIGLAIMLGACAGLRAALVMSFIPVAAGLAGFVLSVVGAVVEKPKLVQEDTHVLGALFAACMSIIGGLVLMAAWLGWTTYR